VSRGGDTFSELNFMAPSEHIQSHPVAVHSYVANDVVAILFQQGWLITEPTAEISAWCERAASLLGQFAVDAEGLEELLRLVFEYDAAEILKRVDAHAVLARYAARDVIRHLALLLIDPTTLTSDRFKEIVTSLKENLELRGRDLFHPIRLVLAGRAGEGELDRVILLLDDAAGPPFAVSVKSARTRVLEFCAALD
jgi:nondiscriminating glutamyl-tRNA synthetase